jgi:hypothetical protein
MAWESFALGALSSVLVGIILTAVKSHFDKEARRIQHQMEVAEMVGAVRAEITHVTTSIGALTKKLDTHIDHCEKRWRVLDFEDPKPTHN